MLKEGKCVELICNMLRKRILVVQQMNDQNIAPVNTANFLAAINKKTDHAF
jgi:hypothetical protein